MGEEKQKENRQNIHFFISSIITLLPGILTTVISNKAVSILAFIFILIWIVCIVFTDEQNKSFPIILAVGLVLITILFACTDSSFSELKNKLSIFFRTGQDETIQTDISPVVIPTDVISSQNASLEQELAEIDSQTRDIYTEITGLYDKLEKCNIWFVQKNEEEINNLLDYIAEREDELIPNNFPHLKTSREDVELFYKTQLTGRKYHYCNIISAMESYGINCKTLSIDEYDLIRWDIEVLFIYYEMKKSLCEHLTEDTVYPLNRFTYNDFRINDVEGYEDIFDYKEWHISYADYNYSARDIYTHLNNNILDIFDVFHMNLDSELN